IYERPPQVSRTIRIADANRIGQPFAVVASRKVVSNSGRRVPVWYSSRCIRRRSRPRRTCMRRVVVSFLAVSPALLAQDRKVEPSWLYRDVSAIQEHATDLSSGKCHYTPIFGEGDSEGKLPLSVARFGELTIDSHGECPSVTYPRQEELLFVLE